MIGVLILPVITIVLLPLVVGLITTTFILYLVFVLPIGYIIQKLYGDNALRSVFVYWGVIFFIVGNFLQFISTF